MSFLLICPFNEDLFLFNTIYFFFTVCSIAIRNMYPSSWEYIVFHFLFAKIFPCVFSKIGVVVDFAPCVLPNAFGFSEEENRKKSRVVKWLNLRMHQFSLHTWNFLGAGWDLIQTWYSGICCICWRHKNIISASAQIRKTSICVLKEVCQITIFRFFL